MPSYQNGYEQGNPVWGKAAHKQKKRESDTTPLPPLGFPQNAMLLSQNIHAKDLVQRPRDPLISESPHEFQSVDSVLMVPRPL